MRTRAKIDRCFDFSSLTSDVDVDDEKEILDFFSDLSKNCSLSTTFKFQLFKLTLNTSIEIQLHWSSSIVLNNYCYSELVSTPLAQLGRAFHITIRDIPYEGT